MFRMEDVFLRIAFAETDAQFEASIEKFLPDVISALPVSATQQKALEIITHVKKRLTSRKEVKVPIVALLDQYEQRKGAILCDF